MRNFIFPVLVLFAVTSCHNASKSSSSSEKAQSKNNDAVSLNVDPCATGTNNLSTASSTATSGTSISSSGKPSTSSAPNQSAPNQSPKLVDVSSIIVDSIPAVVAFMCKTADSLRFIDWSKVTQTDLQQNLKTLLILNGQGNLPLDLLDPATLQAKLNEISTLSAAQILVAQTEAQKILSMFDKNNDLQISSTEFLNSQLPIVQSVVSDKVKPSLEQIYNQFAQKQADGTLQLTLVRLTQLIETLMVK